MIPNYQTNVNFNDNIFADSVSITSTYINFINAAYSTSTTTTQTFGIASCCSSNGASVAINAIASDHTEVILSFSSGNPVFYINYTMPAGIGYTYPQNVVINYGSTLTIGYASYFTTSTDFNACSAPCVYLNQSNKTMIVKGLISPDTIDIWYSPSGTSSGGSSSGGGGGSSGGGGGGGGVGQQIGNAINNIAQGLPTITPAFVGNPAFNVLAEMVTIGVAAFILLAAAFSRTGRNIGGRTRQPSVNVGRTKSSKVSTTRTKSPRITMAGGGMGIFKWGKRKTDYDLP